jgi:adenosylcobinamide-GDP ribazoletransferase
MVHELRIFFTAIMYYTRIPCPAWVDHKEEYLNQATKYFPLVGWIVGGVAAVVFFIFDLFFDSSIAIVLSMAASILSTGAFHEDGFADVCDGFGGGWTKEKILLIMKDSRLGTYGVIGVVFILAMKFLALSAINDLPGIPTSVFLLILVSSHALSRFFAASFIFTHSYVRLSEDSKAKPVASNIRVSHLYLAGIFGFFPFVSVAIFSQSYLFCLILLPLILLRQYLGYYFKKWIGGYTGDCLGAVQQLSEVLFYLSFIILWRFSW